MTGDLNAIITPIAEPAPPRERLPRAHAARQGSDRYRRHTHDVRVTTVCRSRAGAECGRRRSGCCGRRRRRRQGTSARVRLERARREPVVGTGHNPTHPGKTTGGSSSGNAAALAAGLCDLGIGTDTGCSIRLPSAACETVGLKTRLGLVPTTGVFPLCPSFDTVGPMGRTVEDVALFWSVLAAQPMPEPRLDGLTVGLLRTAPAIGDGRTTESSDAAEAWVSDLERLGARVVEARVPDAPGDPWPLFLHEAARSHDATFPSRAAEYGDVMRTKLELAHQVTPEGVAAARRALADWQRFTPEVDLYVSRASRSSSRPRTSTSARCGCRSPRSCAGSTCSAGPGSRSATSSWSLRSTRRCSPPGSHGSAGKLTRVRGVALIVVIACALVEAGAAARTTRAVGACRAARTAVRPRARRHREARPARGEGLRRDDADRGDRRASREVGARLARDDSSRKGTAALARQEPGVLLHGDAGGHQAL